MGARSRKRGRSAGAGAPARKPAPPPPTPPPEAPADDSMRRGYARGRARDEAIRESLEPLAPGERPGIVTFAAGVAFVFAIGNVLTALTGNDLSGASGDPVVTTTVTTAVLLLAGFGMLARQYWAVLGFQTILGLQIIFFSLYLIGVQKWWQAIVCIIAIGLLGTLFWKLVRPMARLQMPTR
ncbi:MAG TPA: hypothetical protein VMY78_13645 [Solirubrobacteraceae bacterium]|nr:hypothetical protein [Solirubrobacteraceae bacterium]